MVAALVITAAMAVLAVTVVTSRVAGTLAGGLRAAVAVVCIVTGRVISALAVACVPPLSSFAS